MKFKHKVRLYINILLTTFLCKTLIFLSLISTWSLRSPSSLPILFLSCVACNAAFVFFSISLFFSSNFPLNSSTYNVQKTTCFISFLFILTLMKIDRFVLKNSLKSGIDISQFYMPFINLTSICSIL